jgi:hypothetical protein
MAPRSMIIASVLCALACALCAPARRLTAPTEPSEPSPRVDFDKQVKPILEARCRPCHFEGGTMYGRLPFDRPQTIRSLGTRLFSRIKDDDARSVILSFLAESGDLQPSETLPSDGP